MTDLITRAVLEKAVLDRLQAVHGQTRAELAAALKVTERRPTEHNGIHVGTVTKKRPAKSARVVDSAALLAWAQEHRPEEVEEVTTYRVRPATAVAWATAIKGGDAVVSETTGEMLTELPGIAVSEGTPVVEIKLESSEEALAVFEQLVQAGLAEINAPFDSRPVAEIPQ